MYDEAYIHEKLFWKTAYEKVYLESGFPHFLLFHLAVPYTRQVCSAPNMKMYPMAGYMAEIIK